MCAAAVPLLSRPGKDRDGTRPLQWDTSGKMSELYCRALRASVSRCAPSATANCSPLRRKYRRALPALFFGLRGSLLSCSRALRALVSRFACSQRTASLRLGLVSGACGPSPRPRSGPSVLLATAQTLLASRVEPWDFRLTPESSSGVGLFYCLPQNTRRNYHGRRKQRV